MQHLILLPGRGLQADNCSDSIAIRFGSNQLDSQPVVLIYTIVVKQQSGSTVCGHEQIQTSIIIYIGISRAAAQTWRAEGGSHLRGYLAKFPLAKILKEMGRLAILNALLDLFNIIIYVS